MSQPQWNLIAQLGDKNPIEHGGYFVYEDATGVYAPEGEYLESPPDHLFETHKARWRVFRFSLELCTYENGVLSDNSFHPDHPAWWADDIPTIASSISMPPDTLRGLFCSDDILERAYAYRSLGEIMGFINLDEEGLILQQREVDKRYKAD